jgi:hypothetical protein
MSQIPYSPFPSTTETDRESQHQFDVASDQALEHEFEQSFTPAAAGNEQVVAAGAYVDIKVDQNEGQVIGQWYEAVQRHSGAELPRKWVEGELKNYVKVGNEEELAGLLESNRVLVLQAEAPGAGRWTAALHLLSSARGPRLTIRRIRRESGDSLDMSGLRGRRETGWILDLRDPDESVSEKADFGHELRQVSDLRSDGSYLVVLASTALWQRVGRGATDLTRTLEPPRSLDLFKKVLESSDISSTEAWAQKFEQRVKPLQPAVVLTWSEAFISSYKVFEKSTGHPPFPEIDKDVEEIEKIVQNAVSGWMETLASWHAKEDRTSYDRNYLLLAAVYNGARIDDVHRRIASLADALGEKGQKSGPLEGQQGPGLVQLARQINAILQPDGSLRFPGPGFAEAVVRYFWLDRPHLTNDFLKWTIRLSRDLELERPEESHLAEQLASRMIPWVLNHTQATNSTSLLRLVASEWSESRSLDSYARGLLVMACLDPKVGSRSRRAVVSWVNQKDTSPALLQTLARLFGSLTPAHKRFLGRLGELASSETKGVSQAVGEAIRDLWENEEFRPNLRNELTSWFDSENEQRKQAAASAFLRLALQRDTDGNLTLLSELGTSDWVMRGWRAVLDERQPSSLTYSAFIAWMDVAVVSTTAAEAIFATLVSAVHDTSEDEGRARRYLNLGRLGERWILKSTVLSEPVREKFRYELDRRAQQADPESLAIRDKGDSPVA